MRAVYMLRKILFHSSPMLEVKSVSSGKDLNLYVSDIKQQMYQKIELPDGEWLLFFYYFVTFRNGNKIASAQTEKETKKATIRLLRYIFIWGMNNPLML